MMGKLVELVISLYSQYCTDCLIYDFAAAVWFETRQGEPTANLFGLSLEVVLCVPVS
jgi:hypothetical protein